MQEDTAVGKHQLSYSSYIKSEIPGVDTIDHALELSKLGSENIEALSGIDDKLVLLAQFSEIEVQIEPIERQIEELVADIDERVNLQVDEMRMQETPERRQSHSSPVGCHCGMFEAKNVKQPAADDI